MPSQAIESQRIFRRSEPPTAAQVVEAFRAALVDSDASLRVPVWNSFLERRERAWLPEAASDNVEGFAGALRSALSAYGIEEAPSVDGVEVDTTETFDDEFEEGDTDLLSDEMFIQRALELAVTPIAAQEFTWAAARRSGAVPDTLVGHARRALLTYARLAHLMGTTPNPW